MSWEYNGRETWGASNYGDPYYQEMTQWNSSAHRYVVGDAQRQMFGSHQVFRYSNPSGGMASMSSAGMQPALQWQPQFQLPAPSSFTNSHPGPMSHLPNFSSLSISSSPGKKAVGKAANSSGPKVPKALAAPKAGPKTPAALKAGPKTPAASKAGSNSKAPAAQKAASKAPAAQKAASKAPAAQKAAQKAAPKAPTASKAAPKAGTSGSKKPAGGLQVQTAAALKSTSSTAKKTVTKAQDAKIDVSIGTRGKILISVDLKNGSCTEVKPGGGRKRANCDPAAVSTPKKMKK